MFSDTSPYEEIPPPPPTKPIVERRGWNGSDLAIGGAVIVLIIALFLPWFSMSANGGTADGLSSHGDLWVVFVLALLALIVLVARDAIARLPGNLPSPEQMLVGATGLALLLTILGVVQKPSSVAVLGSVGWSYGGWVALVAAIVAFLAAFWEAGALQSGRGMTMPSLRRRGSGI
ncbi:MAG TPA: hypothetical protein VME44_05320 [Streptosporangiaceae bacterium]|nr:hypothetical protein [Streptosporangiaceae bacterium]